ncbi:glycoside hydrolase family 30 beta sandwich domain-containing protein [Limibacter armeniacum]|uniref:glycoside hydrolase family 30 protein n=1 Tax=Limibacter armeniacum TaxID=466084 RepID=UPI002FE637B0
MNSINKKTLLALGLAASIWAGCDKQTVSHNGPSEVVVTTPDKTKLFEKQQTLEASLSENEEQVQHITIDTSKVYQEIDGFGFTLTGGSAYHINRMSPEARQQLLEELFGTKDGQVGFSYLRISVAASDLDFETYSYDDLPEGVETDPELKYFTLAKAREDLIPVLKDILKIFPELKIMGSPWSPPTWMKTNGDTRGGELKPEFYGAYADYLVKYLEKMEEEGIHIDALTIQNEPLHPGNNPSLLMHPEDQAEFIKNHLGPKIREAALSTKLIAYDHNADRPDYPITILNDEEANQYVDGSAFHLYGGTIDALSEVHEAHPDKNIYFTEQWIGAPGNFSKDIRWHTRELIIGGTRNWSRTVLEWNLAADSKLEPYTDRGGCNQCLGAITIDGDTVTRNPAYYIIAHASRYVRPGAVRVESNIPDHLPNVAFKTTDNKVVQIVLNDSDVDKQFDVNYGETKRQFKLEAGSVMTIVW